MRDTELKIWVETGCACIKNTYFYWNIEMGDTKLKIRVGASLLEEGT